MAEQILEILSRRQFVSPHRSVGLTVADTADDIGACPTMAAAVLVRLEIPAELPVGRIRRCQLFQLARVLERCKNRAVRQASS